MAKIAPEPHSHPASMIEFSWQRITQITGGKVTFGIPGFENVCQAAAMGLPGRDIDDASGHRIIITEVAPRTGAWIETYS
jgi:hypothetical protein